MNPTRPTRLRIPPWLPAALFVTCMVLGCGGGGGGSVAGGGVGVGGTGGSGRVSGFGSIIVNGVRFDNQNVNPVDDGGAAFASPIALGMVVDVTAGPSSVNSAGDTVATASKVQVNSVVRGRVEARDATVGTLTVLGQSVRTDAATVYSGLPNKLSDLVAGVSDVEVYGFYDAARSGYLATRIERLQTPPADYKVRGPVTGLNTKATTFVLGTITVNYSGVNVPSDLGNGQVVRVVMGTTGSPAYAATSVTRVARSYGEGEAVKIEGVVANAASGSDPRTFTIDGTAVNATSGQIAPNGAQTTLTNGLRVEAEGTVQGGVLVASKVSIKSSSGSDVTAKLIGTMSAINTTANTFTLTIAATGATYAVSYNDNPAITRIDGLNGNTATEADFQNGIAVEAEGTVSSDGTQLSATRIKLR